MPALPERIGKQLYLYLRTYALVENVVDRIEYGHIDVHAAVYLFHTLRSEVAFGYHFHLYLRTLHAVALANHGAESAVAREIAVARDEQVAEINRVVDAALHWMYGVEEARHLLNGVGHEHGLEVVAELQTAANACRYGVDVLQDRRIFDADDIAAGLCLDVVVGQNVGKRLRLVLVGAAHREV